MALQYSPKIVQDGLVMCLDASQNKSYPTDLPVKNGLNLWLDAADDTTFSYSSGTVVSQWRDKSGNNFHASQSTTSQQPSRNTTNNSRKSVFFNASSRLDYMTISSGISLPSDASIFIIYKPSTQVYNYAVLIDNYHGLGGSYGFVIQRVNNLSQFYYGNGNGSGFVDTSASPWTYTDNAIQLLSLNKLGATATPYISGTAQTSRTVYANTAQYTTALAIGYWGNGGGRFYNGDMCEILVFNRALSSTEMKQVHTYLGQKWGISNTDRSIVDLSGNNYSGLLGNNTASSIPSFDYYNKGAFKLDGSNDYITTGISGIIPNSTSSYTVSTWVNRNRNNVGYEELLSQWTYANSGNSFFFGFNNSNVRFTDNWNDVVVSGAGNTNVWMNLVGVYSVSNAYIYLNGALIATKGSGFYYTGTGSLVIGRQGELDSEYFNGNLSNVLIYNKALSAAEVLQNYEAQKSKFANSIVQQGLVLNLDAGNPYSYAGAGTTIYDVSPTALSWTGSNVTYNSDPVKYFSYNGSNSWLQSSTSTAYDSQTITMECWCYPNTLSQEGFLFEKGQVNTQYSMFFESVTNPNFVFRTMGTVSNQNLVFNPNTYLTVNAWNHIVCTYNGSSKIMYVNGVQVASVAASGTLPTGQINQYIGRHSGGYFFNGRIAESRVYNIALSAAQVLQNYNATKGRFGL